LKVKRGLRFFRRVDIQVRFKVRVADNVSRERT
jgi:hypothetical protein